VRHHPERNLLCFLNDRYHACYDAHKIIESHVIAAEFLASMEVQKVGNMHGYRNYMSYEFLGIFSILYSFIRFVFVSMFSCLLKNVFVIHDGTWN
jgi:hypothetical protein